MRRGIIKSPREIETMHALGTRLWRVLCFLRDSVRAGERGEAIEARAVELLRQEGLVAVATELSPAGLSINAGDVVSHGTPSGVVLNAGELVTLDLVAGGHDARGRLWHVDAAVCVRVPGAVRGVSEERQAELLRGACVRAVEAGIARIRPGERWGEVVRAMRAAVGDVAEDGDGRGGFAVLEGGLGHGIGMSLHEPPALGYGEADEACELELAEGMVVTIEPIVGLSGTRLVDGPRGLVTVDGSMARYEERTLAVVGKGCRVLTGGA